LKHKDLIIHCHSIISQKNRILRCANSTPEIAFVGRLKGRDILRGADVDGWVIIHIRMGFKGNTPYVWKVWRLKV